MRMDAHTTVAVIGGTGMNSWPGLEIVEARKLDTPFGATSAPLIYGRIHGGYTVFLARHGEGHKIPPHCINYRANLWALHSVGVRSVVAVSAVGGIAPWLPPAALALPDDVIDYTWGRAHTYSDGSPSSSLHHVELTPPYSARVRETLLRAAGEAGIELAATGVLGVTQGPRLETAAEIRRLQRDGCDMVGMTGMPEAALARELRLDYACLAVSVNWAAGLTGGESIHAEIEESVAAGMARVRAVLQHALPKLTAG